MSAKAPVLVSDVLPAAKPVITLNSSASLDDALRCLDAHHIRYVASALECGALVS